MVSIIKVSALPHSPIAAPFCRQAPTRPFYLAANLQGRPLRRDWQFTLQFTVRGKYIQCINNVRKSERDTWATQPRLSANKQDLENFIKLVNTVMDPVPVRNYFPLFPTHPNSFSDLLIT